MGKSEDVQWEDPAGYHTLSCSQTISAFEELIELTSPVKDLVRNWHVTINKMMFPSSLKGGSVPDSAMHVRMDSKSLPEPDFSVRKTNAFYYNKLILALHDLKSSGLIVKSTKKRGRDVLMDDDYRVNFYPIAPLVDAAEYFDGQLIKYMTQLRESCLILMVGIMGKLEAVSHPVNLFREDDNNIMLEWLKKVRFNKLRNSANAARDTRHGIQLARYAASLTQGISSSIEDASAELTDMLRRRGHYFEFAPQAILVLLLLDCGAFRKAGEKMEALFDDKPRDSNNYSVSHQYDANFSDSNGSAKTHTSAKIFATILQILKSIGTSDAHGAPTSGEVVLLEQIMEHVSLCIDGFLCAKAYQKERDLRRTPYAEIGRELYRIGENNGAIAFYCKYGCGVEGMSERLKQLQEGFNL